MSDTTNILDLPTDPAGGNGNISILASDIKQNNNQQMMIQPQMGQNPNVQGNLSLDQSTINQIINGLQQASITGSTQLASRDIPINTYNLVQDPNIQPNYVPPINANKNNDYIKNDETTQDILQKYNQNMNKSNNLDEFYNEFQGPFLLAILYFLFQLPIIKKNLFTYFPAFFNTDGNYNLSGFLFTSIIFGGTYHFLNKINYYFSTF